MNGSITTNWLVDPDGYYIDKTLLLQASDDGADDVFGTADDTLARAIVYGWSERHHHQ